MTGRPSRGVGSYERHSVRSATAHGGAHGGGELVLIAAELGVGEASGRANTGQRSVQRRPSISRRLRDRAGALVRNTPASAVSAVASVPGLSVGTVVASRTHRREALAPTARLTVSHPPGARALRLRCGRSP